MGDVSERLTAEVGGFVSGMQEAGSAARRAASDVKKLRDAAAELGAAGGGMAALDAELDGVRDRATEAAAAMAALKRETRGATSASAGGGLDRGLRDLSKAGKDAEKALSGLGGGRRGGILGDLKSGAKDAEEAATGLESVLGSIGQGVGQLSGFAMPAVFTGLAAAIGTVGPVALAAGAGLASFGALAAPALNRVKTGYQAVSQAQKAYQQASQLEAVDPTKSHLAAQAQDAAKLKAAWASIPADVRPGVRAIQGLDQAWHQLARKSGIQKDVFADIPKVAKDIKGLFPAISGLAKATAPVVSQMLSGLGRFEKSSGFSKFIGNLEREIGPGSRALHSFGNALSTIMSDLTTPKNMQAGNKLLTSLSGLMKTSAPGGTSFLQHVANGITAVSNALSTAEKRKSGPNESSLNMVLGFLGEAGGGVEHIGEGLSRESKAFVRFLQSHGNSQMNEWAKKHLGISFGGQGSVPKPAPAPDFGQQVRDAMRKAWSAKNLSSAQLFGKGSAPSFIMRPKLTVDPQVKVKPQPVKNLSFDKLFPGMHDASKGVMGAKPVTVSVTPHVDAGKAKADVQRQMDSAAKSVKIHGVTVSLSNAKLSGLDALQGAMRKAGQQAGHALDQAAGSAISSGASAAGGRARAITAAARGALAPMPGQFHAIGMSAAQGLASGIAAGTGAAVAAAAAMAHAVEKAAKVHFEAHSPSRKFQRIGADVIAGFILGVQGGKSQVQTAMHAVFGTPFTDAAITSAIDKLKKDVQDAFNRKLAGSVTRGKLEQELGKAKKGTAEYKRLEKELHGKTEFKPISKTQELELTKLLDRDNKKLMALAKQRQSLVNQIKAAEALSASVKSAAIAGADITGIAGNTQQGLIQADQAQGALGSQQNPYQNIQQGLQSQLSQIKKFRADIVKLKHEGLDRTSIKQLLAAGVTGGGLSTAEQLLGEGKGGVKKVAELQKEIGKAAGQLGVTGANAAYESGRDLGRGLAAGLKDSLKDVNKAMSNIAKSLVTSLMTALGASSKDIKKALQKLDKELGLGDGSGGGHKMKPPHIVEHHRGEKMHPGPVRKHAPMMHPDSMTMLPPGGYAGGGGSDVITINIHNETTLDGKVVARTVQTHTLRRARRNTRSGMTLPLRGT